MLNMNAKTGRHALEARYNRVPPGLGAQETRARLEGFLKKGLKPFQEGTERIMGFNAVMLNVTDIASQSEMPLAAKDLLTRGGGQIKTQRGAPNRTLKLWGARFRFGTESGGTSRNSLQCMEACVDFLNDLHATSGPVNFFAAMRFWLRRIRDLFRNAPLSVDYSTSETLQVFVGRLVGKVREREKLTTGTKLMGAVMQHLVGAKLELILGSGRVEHHPATQADQQYGRFGDFEADECVFHVTTAPAERLIQKCVANIEANKKPIIITLSDKVAAAAGLAQNMEVDSRIEVIGFEVFLAHNVIERTLARRTQCRVVVEELVEKYNALVAKHEPLSGIRLKVD